MLKIAICDDNADLANSIENDLINITDEKLFCDVYLGGNSSYLHCKGGSASNPPSIPATCDSIIKLYVFNLLCAQSSEKDTLQYYTHYFNMYLAYYLRSDYFTHSIKMIGWQ